MRVRGNSNSTLSGSEAYYAARRFVALFLGRDVDVRDRPRDASACNFSPSAPKTLRMVSKSWLRSRGGRSVSVLDLTLSLADQAGGGAKSRTEHASWQIISNATFGHWAGICVILSNTTYWRVL